MVCGATIHTRWCGRAAWYDLGMVVLRSGEEMTVSEEHLRESVEAVAQLLANEDVAADIEVGLVADPEEEGDESTRVLVLVRTPLEPARFLGLIAEADQLLRGRGLLDDEASLALDFRPEW